MVGTDNYPKIFNYIEKMNRLIPTNKVAKIKKTYRKRVKKEEEVTGKAKKPKKNETSQNPSSTYGQYQKNGQKNFQQQQTQGQATAAAAQVVMQQKQQHQAHAGQIHAITSPNNLVYVSAANGDPNQNQQHVMMTEQQLALAQRRQMMQQQQQQQQAAAYSAQ